MVCFALSACLASDKSESPQQRRRGSGSRSRVYKTSIIPHWFADNTRFWYRNNLRDDNREFIVVDASKGTRRRAFDHGLLAEKLRSAGVKDALPERLPIEKLDFDYRDNALVFQTEGKHWKYFFENDFLGVFTGDRAKVASWLSAISATHVPSRSTRTGPDSAITFVNRTPVEVELFWLDRAGGRHSYGKLKPGQEREQHTYAGHVWRVYDENFTLLAAFESQESRIIAEITDTNLTKQTTPEPEERRPRPQDESPDGKWTALIKDYNIYIRSKDGENEVRLSRDGGEGNAYGMLQWAPDSKTLVAWRIEPGDRKEVYLVESSPEGGGRAKLGSRPYALPGDKFTSYELNLFDMETKEQSKPDLDRIDFGRPRLRWNSDGRRFTYQKTDRGHQRFRVIEVDSHAGNAHTIIDEKSETFIWTAHTENVRTSRVNWISNTNEIIYVSERDGRRHLYLVDAGSGQFKSQITKGRYVVRAIDRIDEKERQIWFRASGRDPDQDPYLIHYYRVNFDGTGLVALTTGDGTHSTQYSPDRKYVIDTYSRVDIAPVHELRRTSDGKKVCKLEEADISELTDNGWEAPEVFVAKGRDGRTDIWGIICRPADFDPQRKYPIIEDIYAGPHGSHVPKVFSNSRRYASLTELGFIVVKIDGMGTANRSKAFHDVCWHNLKDAGLPDRILWIKAAAKKYPYMDTSRVGIYGTSAGGQNAAGAVLFHPEFYKVAVASCGCHDNRMDKASWNEQWMGYPVGPHYAECSNIDNAHRLQGKLMLIVGEMDTNVPPESTIRFVDALIKADKDFDLIVVPGAGHGNGGAYGRRRMHDFFVEHLSN
jgi:dipeptidyl-peptidase-4